MEKCYDLLARPLCYVLGHVAGMATKFLGAYLRFQEGLRYAVKFAPGMGVFRGHRRGLPQRCALTQVFLALMIIPWYRKLRLLGARPRALADDLHFSDGGETHAAKAAAALDLTAQFVDACGGHMKVEKSLFFS